MSRYTKFLIALLGGLASWGATAAPDYSQADLWGLAAILATALSVFQFPNTPPAGEESDPSVSEIG